MRCANPDCTEMAHDISTGVLRLMELDVPPEKRVIRSDSGFPVCAVPSRYFWLCSKCGESLRIRRWTREGLVLEPRLKNSPPPVESRKDPLPVVYRNRQKVFIEEIA
jgi:hypothetical protein